MKQYENEKEKGPSNNIQVYVRFRPDKDQNESGIRFYHIMEDTHLQSKAGKRRKNSDNVEAQSRESNTTLGSNSLNETKKNFEEEEFITI